MKSAVLVFSHVVAVMIGLYCGGRIEASVRAHAAPRRVVVYRDPTPIPADPRCHGYRLNGVADVRCIPPIPRGR